MEFELRIFLNQTENRAAASDFDIVAMRTKTQDSANPVLRNAAKGNLMHAACRRKCARDPARCARCSLPKEFPRPEESSTLPTARDRKPACLREFGGL